MNFGNPEKPEIMGQFVECIRGMGEACKKLHYPVISGNVSLYNETNGEGIYPTPAIGGVGLIKNLTDTMTINFKGEGNVLCLIGKTDNHLGNSQYLSIIKNTEAGGTPRIDLDEELKNGKFILDCIADKLLKSVHDVGEGGILVAVSEMCIYGKLGVAIDVDKEFLHGFLFGEDQARYLVEVSSDDLEKINTKANEKEVLIEKIGLVGGSALLLNSIGKVELPSLISAHSQWFNQF